MFDPVAELEELLGRPVDRDATLSDRRAHHIGLVEQEELRPGVREILVAGREAGLTMAVASSSSRDWVERWLGHHAIREYFTCVCSRDDVRQVKPAPDLFLCAAACLDVAPGECIVFEDSPNGMRAAAAAGMHCVAVPNSLTADLELPPVALRVDSLAELPLAELIERVEVAPVPAAG
jgi:HAD superfamily hydrolase (TIGR01509 family)